MAFVPEPPVEHVRLWSDTMKETETSAVPEKKKNKLMENLKQKKTALIHFIERVSRGEPLQEKGLSRLIKTIKVFIVSTRKFNADECVTKASSLTYTIIISLIPTLTVALMIYPMVTGLDKGKIFIEMNNFLKEVAPNLNTDILINAVRLLVDNAGKIAGVSLVVVIFSATAMLRSLEKSLNDIWKIKRQRPLFLKIVYYWAALTLGPVMLVAGTTVAAQVSDFFSSPDFNSVHIDSSKRLWIAGDKTTIKLKKSGKMSFNNIGDKNIDFDNQRVYKYDIKDNSFEREEITLDALTLKGTHFRDIQFIGTDGWAVGSNGIILHTTNGGERWDLKKWGNISFNDIHMVSEIQGFIAANNGAFLKTEDGGISWEVMRWENALNNFKRITFKGNNGIVSATKGTILQTDDRGKTWTLKKLKEAKREYVTDINNAYFGTGDKVWLACDAGLILFSENSGATWKQIRFKKFNYHDVWFKNRNTGLAVGSRGMVITTKNGGSNWKVQKLPTPNINDLIVSGTTFWAAGDSGMLMASNDQGLTWKGTEGRSFIGMVLNFIAPFIIIWFLFFLCYISLPNTKVPVKGAAIGAAFTGAVWVIFILAFIVYTKAFARGTFAIYGALASIPIFLLMVYASSVIVLYGAEVSYTLMHPETYRDLHNKDMDRNSIQIYYGIAVLHFIYEKFEKGEGATWFKELQKVCNHQTGQVDFFTKEFLEAGLIYQNDEFGYMPSNSSENIKINDVMELLQDVSLNVPAGIKKSGLKMYMTDLFTNLAATRSKVLDKVTLRDIIQKS